MPAADHEIRAAAESLLNSSSSFHQRPSPTQLSHSMSINTRPDYLLPADLITGSRQSGRMSVVRRFFCLLVTFDLLFTSLMWLIALMMAAISRFTVLLLFYGVLSINHWCVIAWSIASQPVFQVLLILVSFIISWGEVWFLDFKVLPQEQQANDFLQASPLYAESERAPLLGNYLQGLTRHEDYNESVGNFYSPMDSPEGSDDERDPSGHKGEERIHQNKPLLSQEDQYRQDGIEALEVSWQMLNSADWKLEKLTRQGDTIHSKQLAKSRKIFKLTSPIDLPPKTLFAEMYHKIENVPSWNPTLKESRIIQVIDGHTDISYQVAAEGAGGIVSSRDFVNLRCWGMKGDCYVAAGVSVLHPDVPPCTNYIRGENGPTCWVFRPVAGHNDQCIVEWLLNTNLRGWIPQYVLDPALMAAMINYIVYLRKYLVRLQK
uniref:START domain-containing protein n=1 Tax=Timema shepardi TaxID=629360 RepID=A0A7R9G307_TIMSH|nr:unnamed protein product [Timema shepardi]